MTNEQVQEFDMQLAARGWRYDTGNQEFRDGDRLLEWEDVIGLIDDLAAYEDARWDKPASGKMQSPC